MENDLFDKPLKIDNRPMWLIVIDHTARYQLIAGFLVICIILFRLAPPPGLSLNGYHAVILFGATIFLWVSGLLPIAVTALLSMVMLPLLGIMEAKKTYALFGNEAVFFILGAFILAAAMTADFPPGWPVRCSPASARPRPGWRQRFFYCRLFFPLS